MESCVKAELSVGICFFSFFGVNEACSGLGNGGGGKMSRLGGMRWYLELFFATMMAFVASQVSTRRLGSCGSPSFVTLALVSEGPEPLI